MTMMTPADDALVDGGRAGLEASAALFRALADPSRLVILSHLQLGPHRVVDLVEHLGLAQSTVSKHLACLRECGLVQSRPRGRASVFSLVPDGRIREVLVAAEAVLAVTGEASTHCATVGGEL